MSETSLTIETIQSAIKQIKHDDASLCKDVESVMEPLVKQLNSSIESLEQFNDDIKKYLLEIQEVDDKKEVIPEETNNSEKPIEQPIEKPIEQPIEQPITESKPEETKVEANPKEEIKTEEYAEDVEDSLKRSNSDLEDDYDDEGATKKRRKTNKARKNAATHIPRAKDPESIVALKTMAKVMGFGTRLCRGLKSLPVEDQEKTLKARLIEQGAIIQGDYPTEEEIDLMANKIHEEEEERYKQREAEVLTTQRGSRKAAQAAKEFIKKVSKQNYLHDE